MKSCTGLLFAVWKLSEKRHIPDEFRQSHGEISWANMVGMRDRLIHGYFGIDYEIVWDVITNIIPDLRDDIERLIQSETDD